MFAQHWAVEMCAQNSYVCTELLYMCTGTLIGVDSADVCTECRGVHRAETRIGDSG